MRHGHLLLNQVQLPGVAVMQTSWFGERMRGLLWRTPLVSGQVLWITRCNSIHTFFMAYAIDVVFVDRKGMVCKVCRDIKPWSVAGSLPASESIEMLAGTAEQLGIVPGVALGFLFGDSK